MRFYSLTNMYLSSLQNGIQTAHCVTEMAIQYGFGLSLLPEAEMFRDWAENHKTMILLNGGNQESLQEFVLFLSLVPENTFAWGTFNEDEQSLNNALTCIGIVLPERIYNSAALMRQRTTEIVKINNEDHNYMWITDNMLNEYTLSVWEYELCERLNQCGLAK